MKIRTEFFLAPTLARSSEFVQDPCPRGSVSPPSAMFVLGHWPYVACP